MLGAILVIIGIVLAGVDAFAYRRPHPNGRYGILLNVAVILIGLGILLGVDPLISINGD